MNTFLLLWNPTISNYKIEDFKTNFKFKGSDYGNYLDDLFDIDRMPEYFSWSVHDYENAQEGDKFFFVKVGDQKPTGIVASGTFMSKAYEAVDWSGRGRKTFYCELHFDSIVAPDSEAVFPTERLQEAIPEIEWTKGHSGTLISAKAAMEIEILWKEHLEKAVFNGKYRE